MVYAASASSSLARPGHTAFCPVAPLTTLSFTGRRTGPYVIVAVLPRGNAATLAHAPVEKLFFLVLFRACCDDATAATAFLRKCLVIAKKVWHCTLSCLCLPQSERGCVDTRHGPRQCQLSFRGGHSMIVEYD